MLILPIVVIYKCKLENSASLNTLLKCESNEFIKEIFVYNNSPGEIFIPDYYMGVKVYKIDDYNFIITMQRTAFSKMNVYDKQARTIMEKDKIIDQELADYYKKMIDESNIFYRTTKKSDINLIFNTYLVIAKYVLGYTFDQITENI